MRQRIIIWGNSIGIKKLFYTKNKVIEIVAGAEREVFCRKLFRKFNIFALTSEFLLVLSFVVDNIKRFQTN
jgi:hypothetical protein